MMKNSFINKIRYITLCLLVFTAGTGFCFAQPIAAGSGVLPVKTVIVKFLITMVAVLISLVVVFLLLAAYKKYSDKIIKETQKKSLYGDSYSAPKTMEDAIASFIQKNKL